MPSLRERKTVWQVRYRDRSRDPEYAYDSLPKGEYTKAQAQEEADFRYGLYKRQKYDPWVQDDPDTTAVSEQLTVAEAVDRYTTAKVEAGRRGEATGWSEKTYKSDAPVLRQFAEHVGPSRLAEHLQPAQLRDWVYQDRLAQTTKFTRWSKLCAMMRFWESHGWVSECPRLPGRPQREKKTKATIRPAQLQTICRAYEDLRHRKIASSPHCSVAGVDWHSDAWDVFYYQGFRRSELLNLRVRDVDLTDGLVRIGPEQKGKRGTLIPLTAPARVTLLPYLEKRNPSERVFSTPPGNTRVSDHFREATDHAALQHDRFSDLSPEDVSFSPLQADPSDIDLYTLRHSCCTYWLRKRRRLIWVRHLMRHKSIETTMEYANLLPTDLREMYAGGRPA